MAVQAPPALDWRPRIVVRWLRLGARSRPSQAAGDDRDQGLICKRDQLLMKSCELEMAGDGRAGRGPPWSRSWGLLLAEIAAVSLPWMGTEPGLPSLPVLRSEPRSGDDRVRNQGRFCNIVGGVTTPLGRPCFRMRDASVFEDAGVEPFADQSQQHSIPSSTLEKVAEVAVVNRIEELTNVHIQDPASSHGHRLLPKTRQRLMADCPGRKPYEQSLKSCSYIASNTMTTDR